MVVFQASDSGIPSLSSTLEVKVRVTDINDNAPVFAPPEYSVTYYDTTSRNMEVGFEL